MITNTATKSRRNRLSLLRMSGGWSAVVITYFVGCIVFIASFFGVALLVSNPIILIGTGLVFAAAVVYLGSHLSARILKTTRSNRFACIQSASFSTILLGLIAVFLLRPLMPESDPTFLKPHDGVEYWELTTGSTVAVRHLVGNSGHVPIVYVHGGPGAYSVLWQPIARTVSPLNEAGHDVYFYDQVGGGLSERLDNIEAYSLARHIEDLHAIQERIGAEKVIILASSFGATLTANYMVKYPDSVTLAVFSSPGPLYKPDWMDKDEGSLDDTLSTGDKRAFDAMIYRPRLLAALILSDINPAAAVRFAPEHELGSLFDEIANRFYLQGAMCESSSMDAMSAGYGFWFNKMTGNTLAENPNDPKPQLMRDTTPLLVLRGECDYKTMAVAEQYVSVFPNAVMHEIEMAGHLLVHEQSELYLQFVTEFIARQLLRQ